MNINAGSMGGRFPDFGSAHLEVLSILINNSCNLHCQHCYLKSHAEESLGHDEWLRVFKSVFRDLAPSILCFAGREPLLDSKSVAIWSDAIKLRDQLQTSQSRRTAIGFITNGMSALTHADKILSRPPDYIDVSIDGLPETHDRIRGAGAFDALEPNLRWLIDRFPDRIWVTHTLLGCNLDDLPAFVSFLHREFGLSNFALGLYHEQSNADPALSLLGRINRIPQIIRELGEIAIDGPVEVIIELGCDQIGEVKDLQRMGWRPPIQGGSSDSKRLSNGLVFRINSSSIPTGLWHSVRISSGGCWLAAEDMLYPSEYSKRAVVNMRNCEYNTCQAYEMGLQLLQQEKSMMQASCFA